MTIERLDYNQPPPGYRLTSYRGDRVIFRCSRVGLADSGEPCEHKSQALHLAWNRYKACNDPPGFWVDGSAWGEKDRKYSDAILEASEDAARAAAWTRYDQVV